MDSNFHTGIEATDSYSFGKTAMNSQQHQVTIYETKHKLCKSISTPMSFHSS